MMFKGNTESTDMEDKYSCRTVFDNLRSLSLNKDAVEQSINEQFYSLKDLIERYHKKLLDDLNRLHKEREAQLLNMLGQAQPDKDNEDIPSTITNEDDFKDLFHSIEDKSNKCLSQIADSSPVGVDVNPIVPDYITFTPVTLSDIETDLLPHLFGLLEIDKSSNNVDNIKSNDTRTNGTQFETDYLNSLISNDNTIPKVTTNSFTPVISNTTPVSSHNFPIPQSLSASHHLDLNNFMTRLNLAQLVQMLNATNNNQSCISSATTAISNTPPKDLRPISYVPFENSNLFYNDVSPNFSNGFDRFSKKNVPRYDRITSPTSSPFPAKDVIPVNYSKMKVMNMKCKFGQLGSGEGQFSSPHGFCLGVDEEIVIADTNNNRICIFDKNGEFKYQFGEPGVGEGQLWCPRKIAIIRSPFMGSRAPRYVICDRGNERSRMQIFSRNGSFIRKITIRYVEIVSGLAVTRDGNITIVDSVMPTLYLINEEGMLLRWVDCSEYMMEPSDIAVREDEIYVCDFRGHCVCVFNAKGEYLRKFGRAFLTMYPNGIDISDYGDILVCDSHGNRFHIVVFDNEGRFLEEFHCPQVKVSRCCGLKITSEGYVVTLAKNNHHVLVLNTLYIT